MAKPKGDEELGVPGWIGSARTQELTTFLTGTTVDRPVAILPGVVAGTYRHAKLVHDVKDALSERFPQSDRFPEGFAPPGIISDYSALYNAPGFDMSPRGVPPVDGPSIAIEKLEQGTERQKAYAARFYGGYPPVWRFVLDRMLYLLVGLSEPRSYPVKRESSIGLPTMTRDLKVKAGVVPAWEEAHERIFTLYHQNMMAELYQDFRIAFCGVPGFRGQPDGTEDGTPSTPKVRMVQDWLLENVKASKDLPQDAFHPDYPLFRRRTRQVTAYPAVAVEPLRGVARRIEHYMYTNFGFTFKHRDAESVMEKIKGAATLVFCDVGNHDQVANPEFIEAFSDSISRFFTDDFCVYTYESFRIPMLYRNDYPGGQGLNQVGDPLDRGTFQSNFVNPSGHPCTAVIAKLLGAFYAVVMLVESGHILPWVGSASLSQVRERVAEVDKELELLFTGRHSAVRVLNAGDNKVFAFTDPLAMSHDEFRSLLPFAIMEPAESFLGNVPVVRGGVMELLPSPDSFVIGMMVPEHDIRSHRRKYWAYGLSDRFTSVYWKNPVNFEIKEVISQVMQDSLGVRLQDIIDANMKEPEMKEMRSIFDHEFLMNQDVIYYKFDPEDVSPEILEEYYLSVDPSSFTKLTSYIERKR